jgi:hypothetical protein
MSWLALAQHFSEWDVSGDPMRYALRRVGYCRGVETAHVQEELKD